MKVLLYFDNRVVARGEGEIATCECCGQTIPVHIRLVQTMDQNLIPQNTKVEIRIAV